MKDRSAYRMLNELMGANMVITLRRFHQPIASAEKRGARMLDQHWFVRATRKIFTAN